MVVSRNEMKRSKRGTTMDTPPDSPKRTKVHAQRKFAQGSNVSSPVITPIKEIDRDRDQRTAKCNNDFVPSPIVVGANATANASTELLPNTEDFLTFLCFRGTSILPANLQFFENSKTVSNQQQQQQQYDDTLMTSDVTKPVTSCTKQQIENKNCKTNENEPILTFGVRKRADPIVISKLDKKRRHTLTMQALRRKYQEQRMAKIRAVTIKKMSTEGLKINKNIRTRSISKREASVTHTKNNVTSPIVKKLPVKMKVKRRTILKPKMCLRSKSARFIPRELRTPPVKKRPTKCPTLPKQNADSSEFSSDDNQPLVKTALKSPTPSKIKPKPTKVVNKQHKVLVKKGNNRNELLKEQQQQQQQRPSRKTKEAAALYMEMLGRKLVNDMEVDEDDNDSIDSFPELPNVRRTEQRENEMKAKHHNVDEKRVTRTFKPKPIKYITRQRQNQIVVETNQNKTVSNKSKTKKCMESSFNESDETLPNKSKAKKYTEPNFSEFDEALPNKSKAKKCTEESFSESDEAPPNKSKAKKYTEESLSESDEALLITKTEKSFGEFKESNPSKSKAKKYAEGSFSEFKESLSSKSKAKKSTDASFSEFEENSLNKLKVKKCTEESFSGSDDILLNKSKAKKCVKEAFSGFNEILPNKSKPKKCREESFSESDEVVPNKLKAKKSTEETFSEFDEILPNKSKCTEESFSESDEEPLVKLTTAKNTVTSTETTLIKISSTEKITSLSDDDVEKAFRGFVKPTSTSVVNKCLHNKDPGTSASTTADLLCKDIGRQFGKGKVNMSTEQIEKWLKESALLTNIKQLEEPKNFDPKKVTAPNLKANAKNCQQRKYIFNERQSKLQHKEILVSSSNTKAFSPDNERSVYAFEADMEELPVLNTPFRSHCRRPSSTSATSRSDDDSGRRSEEQTKTKRTAGNSCGAFRLPATFKSKKSASAANNNTKTSIAIQVNLESGFHVPEGNVNMECCSTQTGDDNASTSDQQKTSSRPSNSPSTSSSSTNKRPTVTKLRNFTSKNHFYKTTSSNTSSFPFPNKTQSPQLVEAPTYYPTEKEFQDPLEYIEKIRAHAETFGICRIVPPSNFKPECKVNDDMRFTAYNQYVHKMLYRWGPNFKELMAIKKYLATQSITLTQPPWIGGMEVDLPRLYQTVQSLGGLKEVIEKKRWSKVAEVMKIPKSAQDRVTKLDDIYCKYLLPYDTLSPAEREKLFDEVETDWAKRESRGLSRPKEQTDLESDPEESSDEEGLESELEECTVKGRNMALNAFYRIARNTMSMWFRTMEPNAEEVEQEFWRHVTARQNHLCVHSGSIDSSGWGYGFACNKNSPFARHPWNLKILTNNSGSILRCLGPLMGVTVPTLHVGMVFSTCCWYRDPHGLPWIEYLHTGADKIWYGIPDSMSTAFRSALIGIVPNCCHSDRTLWLPSDTAMVPPSLLIAHGVSLCRVVQRPGQFIVVYPKAFTSSICTGYVVSESVYFASSSWLQTAEQVFQDISDSCESAMFSFERLLLSIANDTRSNPDVLKQILPAIERLRDREQTIRSQLQTLGVKTIQKLPLPDLHAESRRKQQQRRRQVNDADLECELCRTNLYVSLVSDVQENTVYCLKHGLEYFTSKPDQLKSSKLMFTYDIQDFDNLIEKIKVSIEVKSHVKRWAKCSTKTSVTMLQKS